MEQANNFAVLRINPGNVRTLETVAVDARKGKVIERGRSTVLKSDDVIDLKWCGMQG